jgi:hypothetical protein
MKPQDLELEELLVLLEIEEQVPIEVVRNRFITGRTKMGKSSGRRRERKGSRTEAAKARGRAPLVVLIDTRGGCRVEAPLGRGRGGVQPPARQGAGKAGGAMFII